MFFKGDVKVKSELVKKFPSTAAFNKACIGGCVSLPDGSQWNLIPNTSANKLLWMQKRKSTVLFECVEVNDVRQTTDSMP